jgi:TolB-like protein/DNA-binding SARP family transcriptional activator/Tfp pilus assembly protein PilF
MPQVPPSPADRSDAGLRVHTLGSFSVEVRGEPLRFAGRGQRKPLELLKVLIACGGVNVPQERLADALWPKADGDAALVSFNTTLHRLRQLIGSEALLLRGRALSLERAHCRVDALEFAASTDRARLARAAENAPEARAALEEALEHYRGSFLPGEFDPEEIPSARERLHGTFLQAVRELAAGYVRKGAAERAITVFRRGLAVDEVAEDLYDGLMACCLATGRIAEGIAAYRRCEAVLRDTLQTEPSQQLHNSYEQLRRAAPEAPPEGGASVAAMAGAASAATPAPAPRWGRPRVLTAAAAVLLAALVAAGAWRGYRTWRTAAAVAELQREAELPLPDKPSITVLPFSNLGGNPQDAWFSDGLTETLTTDLATFRGLFVIARNSAISYKDRAVPMRQVARELGVRYVLVGSVQRAGGRVRINAQLEDAASGTEMWAKRFDRPVTDLLAVQDEITRAIVLNLSVELGEGEAARLRLNDTQNLRIFELYLRARQLWLNTYTCTALREVIALHEQARLLDPHSYLPHLGLSAAYNAEAMFSCTATPERSLRQAIAEADQALALNPWRAFALVSGGLAHFWLREYPQALVSLERAIAVSPNDADSYAYYGWALCYVGRYEESRAALRKAMRLHPYYPPWYVAADGLAAFWLGRYEEATQEAQLSLKRAPNNLITLAYLAAIEAARGHAQQGRRWAREVLRIKPDFSAKRWVASTQPYHDARDAAHVLALLRQAGLPQ